eukprot:3784831-Rhodomonas_salina.1
MTRDGAPQGSPWCHDGRGVKDDLPVCCLWTQLARTAEGQMPTGREERRSQLELHGLTATALHRTQMAGNADPH